MKRETASPSPLRLPASMAGGPGIARQAVHGRIAHSVRRIVAGAWHEGGVRPPGSPPPLRASSLLLDLDVFHV